jgi:hypothetical protein
MASMNVTWTSEVSGFLAIVTLKQTTKGKDYAECRPMYAIQ